MIGTIEADLAARFYVGTERSGRYWLPLIYVAPPRGRG